jgi:hypothetical protein
MRVRETLSADCWRRRMRDATDYCGAVFVVRRRRMEPFALRNRYCAAPGSAPLSRCGASPFPQAPDFGSALIKSGAVSIFR